MIGNMARRLLALLALAIAGCPEYEIDVAMKVDAEGGAKRRISFRAQEIEDFWGAFRKPAAPYDFAGDAKGGSAEAAIGPGRYPSGIAVRSGAGGEREGEVALETLDCLVGTLHRYRETLGTGLDPSRFSEEAERYATLAAEVSGRALAARFPDADLGALRDHLLRDLAPRAAAALREAQPHLAALVDASRHADGAPVRSGARARALFRILARFGPRIEPESLPEPIGEDYLAEAVLKPFLEKEIAPNLPEARRGEILAALLGGEEGAGNDWNSLWANAWESYAPDPLLRATAEKEARRFLECTLGVGLTELFGDSVTLRIELEMPGTLLATNGELAAHPRVRWRLGGGDFALAERTLFAVSLVPAPWAAGRTFDLGPLLEAGERYRALPEADRAEAARRVRAGCEKSFAEAAEGASEEMRGLVEAFQRAAR